MTSDFGISGHRSQEIRGDFAVIGRALLREIRPRGLFQRAIEQEHGWYGGIISAWLHGRIAMPIEHFFSILGSLGLGTHDFFRLAYPDEEQSAQERDDPSPIPSQLGGHRRKKQSARQRDDASEADPATCLRAALHRAVRASSMTQLAVERTIGWTPRYLSTLLAGRRNLTFLHCLAVLRALEIRPATFFLGLNCEPRARPKS